MKYILLLIVSIFSISNIPQLHAGYESDEEQGSDEEVVAIPTKQLSEYNQALQLFTERFDEQTALQLLPQRFNTIYYPSWLDDSQRTQMELWDLLKDDPKALVTYGLKTVIPNSTLKFVYDHFESLKKSGLVSSNNVESYQEVAKKITFHRAQNLHDVVEIVSGIPGFDPQSTVALWDLHGTLTKVAVPDPGQTNAEVRNLAPEVVTHFAKSGVQNIIVSAWNNIDEVVEQVRNIGLAEVFGIPETYEAQEGTMKLLGAEVSYMRVGDIVSVKINPKDPFYKDKIYALDVLGLCPKTVIFADDSSENASKVAIHFANTKASAGVEAFHIIKLGGAQESEPNQISQTNLASWMKALKLEQ